MMTTSIVDLNTIDDRTRDALFFADRITWDNVRYALAVNNLCGNKCLVRAFISIDRATLLFVVYIPGSNDHMKLTSVVHVLQQLREEADGCLVFEEGITLDTRKRILMKKMDDGPPITHTHHTYDSFTRDFKGHVSYPSNRFCPDPMRNYFMVYNGHMYEFDAIGVADKPYVQTVRMFKSVTHPNASCAIVFSYVEDDESAEFVSVLLMTKSDPTLNVFFSTQDDSSFDVETRQLYLSR